MGLAAGKRHAQRRVVGHTQIAPKPHQLSFKELTHD
jgi:hypothetical protein